MVPLTSSTNFTSLKYYSLDVQFLYYNMMFLTTTYTSNLTTSSNLITNSGFSLRGGKYSDSCLLHVLLMMKWFFLIFMKIFGNPNFDLPAPSCMDDVVDDVVFVILCCVHVRYLLFGPIFHENFGPFFQLIVTTSSIKRQHPNMSLQNYGSKFCSTTH
ncbi:hypothetical protein PPRFG01_0035600 [Plasmodium sp.]|nr:hypothetical protein PPRFG01_0035600 [Plasmodium sp.]